MSAKRPNDRPHDKEVTMKTLSWPMGIGQIVYMAGKEFVVVAADYSAKKIKIQGTDVHKSVLECSSNSRDEFPDLKIQDAEPEVYYMVTKKQLNEFGCFQIELEDLMKLPVPEWATHFARKETEEEIESGNRPRMSLVYVEEIKR